MPKIIDRNREKAMIAEKTLELLNKNTYYTVSMRDIAKALKISKTKMYHYFESKEELIDYCFIYFLKNATGFNFENTELGIDKKIDTIIDVYNKNIKEFGKEMFFIFNILNTPSNNTSVVRNFIKEYSTEMSNSVSQYLSINKAKAESVLSYLGGSLLNAYFTEKKINKREAKKIISNLIKD